MSNIISIEKQLAQKTLKEVKILLDTIGRSLNLVEGNLDMPAFKTNLVVTVSNLVKEELKPAIQNINRVRTKMVPLSRFDIDKKVLKESINSVDKLYVAAVLVKQSLEKITSRSDAYLLVEVAMQESILPALKELLEVWDNYEALLKSVKRM